MSETFLTVKQASKLAQVSEKTIYGRSYRGDFKLTTIGTKLHISKSDLIKAYPRLKNVASIGEAQKPNLVAVQAAAKHAGVTTNSIYYHVNTSLRLTPHLSKEWAGIRVSMDELHDVYPSVGAGVKQKPKGSVLKPLTQEQKDLVSSLLKTYTSRKWKNKSYTALMADLQKRMKVA